ncbi:hypothetical protein K458DRAFT_384752 [Lentithecium fluviatile CBS 122367]|uniref:Uncharacterized protein n=1 Tax=Lentithecium fluviatile CBS 122367 TaxID=1168545 RepID=A0A6G1JEB6_9PLEO|nr:hypothetical protein K458DRAFT_384752 [Lentithecium fluviatile CBS 122367]
MLSLSSGASEKVEKFQSPNFLPGSVQNGAFPQQPELSSAVPQPSPQHQIIQFDSRNPHLHLEVRSRVEARCDASCSCIYRASNTYYVETPPARLGLSLNLRSATFDKFTLILCSRAVMYERGWDVSGMHTTGYFVNPTPQWSTCGSLPYTVIRDEKGDPTIGRIVVGKYTNAANEDIDYDCCFITTVDINIPLTLMETVNHNGKEYVLSFATGDPENPFN